MYEPTPWLNFNHKITDFFLKFQFLSKISKDLRTVIDRFSKSVHFSKYCESLEGKGEEPHLNHPTLGERVSYMNSIRVYFTDSLNSYSFWS